MALLSVNIVVDGIFVGHGVGSLALAGVNIASPVFSVLLSVALLIGVGGGTLYSIAVGREDIATGQRIFTSSFIFLTIITTVLTALCLFFLREIAFFFGANEETVPYVKEYMRILFIFSLFMVWETALSVFVRNDGNPTLAMVGLVVTSIVNIILNYWMIFILHLGVTGAALATVISMCIGLIILSTHFFKKDATLRFVNVSIRKRELVRIHAIGFPSFLSEIGMGVFIIGYNLSFAHYVGTNGLAAFSVINYLHSFMFLMFIGIGSAIQPLVSFYYGANLRENIRKLLKLAEKSALALGFLCILIGFIWTEQLIALFGITSNVIIEYATIGIRLFFFSYLFMGINFIYITYFQSIGYVKPALFITVIRSFILFIVSLFILPLFFGAIGIWLALPVTEMIVALGLFFHVRRRGLLGS